MGSRILEIESLKTYYFTRSGTVKSCDDVSFSLDEGETLGLVGETGCGKSTVGLSILRLIPFPGRIVGGKIMFQGENLLQKDEEYMRKEIRGKRIAMIWQDPSASLDPVFKIKDQIIEGIRVHQESLKKKSALDKAVDLLSTVGIPSASRQIESYPHEFSGGMKQRVMISIALSCQPNLLIADEPTSNLDVTISAQILDLIKELQRKLGSSMILITHNLGVVAENCSSVGVMYCGSLVEIADVKTVFKKPIHPYTTGLLNAIPKPKSDQKELVSIHGSIASPLSPPSGCKFHPRCGACKDPCRTEVPVLKEIENNHWVACHIGND